LDVSSPADRLLTRLSNLIPGFGAADMTMQVNPVGGAIVNAVEAGLRVDVVATETRGIVPQVTASLTE